MVHPVTGRVHASYNQVVTATGRLSSSDPNLQNIPVRTDEGRNPLGLRARPAGLALAGGRLFANRVADMAHYSGDGSVRHLPPRRGHPRPGGQPGSGVPLAEVNRAMRGRRRRSISGSSTDRAPQGLARRLGIERAAAAEFIDGYFQRYPGIEAFLIRILAECRRRGYVKTILGRRRAIRGVRGIAGARREAAERTAGSTRSSKAPRRT